jgi:predicted MFS family arabinose efflux permease
LQTEGFRFVRENQTIKATLYITVVMNVLLFPYVQMVPIIARDILHVDAALMGALQAAEGLGALVGAVLIASAARLNYHGRVYLGGSLLALLGLCVFSMPRWYILSLPVLLLLGLGTAGFGAMQSTIVMLAAREEMRGELWVCSAWLSVLVPLVLSSWGQQRVLSTRCLPCA